MLVFLPTLIEIVILIVIAIKNVYLLTKVCSGQKVLVQHCFKNLFLVSIVLKLTP